MPRVKHPDFEKMDLRAKGRNRQMKCRGVDIFDASYGENKYINLNPITSQGMTSGSCRIEVPISAIPELIEALQKVAAKSKKGATK